uniref:hypothetical protein n=1 Tax=Cellvibrio fontiphilus TaxID=1815559 RepID=UPI002B4C22AB|nr:hypothetical protein [Cellvibrio fontiphilus]
MYKRIKPVLFSIFFITAIGIASHFGGFALLLFFVVLSAFVIAERAFALRRK